MIFATKSILWRIILLHAVALVSALILFPVVLIWVLNRTADTLQVNSLTEQANALAGALHHRVGNRHRGQ